MKPANSAGKEVPSKFEDEQFELQEKLVKSMPRAHILPWSKVAARILAMLVKGAKAVDASLSAASSSEGGRQPCIVLILNCCYSIGVAQEFAKLADGIPPVFKGRIFMLSVAAKWPGQCTPELLHTVLRHASANDPGQQHLQTALREALQTNYASYSDMEMLNGRIDKEAPWVDELRYHTF